MTTIGKTISEENLKKVSGGAGTSSAASAVSGVAHYDAEQKACPKCGSKKLMYKNFTTDDGKGTVIGQCCENGHEWTFGNKIGVI